MSADAPVAVPASASVSVPVSASVPASPHTFRSTTMQRLAADTVTLGYDQRVIARDLSVQIPDHSFTVIVGPNACGKSTLLRALSRMLKPSRGRVLLDGAAIHSMPAQEGRPHAGAAAAVVPRTGRHHGRRPCRARPLPAPGAAAPVVP